MQWIRCCVVGVELAYYDVGAMMMIMMMCFGAFFVVTSRVPLTRNSAHYG